MIMIKDIIVNLALGGARDVAAEYAISIAQEFEAHVAGVAFRYDPVIPATIFGGGLPPGLIDAQRIENENAAQQALRRFDELARRAGVAAETRVLDSGFGGVADLFAQTVRTFDLAVVAQAGPDGGGTEDLIAEGVMFGSGRPLIRVPYIQTAGLTLDRAMVCWDGSRQAARAVADALPFLTRAKTVDVVMVRGDGAKSDEVMGADIGRHLAHHGVQVEVKRITASDVDVTSVILSHAADSAADFMVMGGYGHSRLREFVLGGVTRGILSSMTLPTLMSH
jgi:nucleotide-binding universal stress UspA family protein